MQSFGASASVDLGGTPLTIIEQYQFQTDYPAQSGYSLGDVYPSSGDGQLVTIVNAGASEDCGGISIGGSSIFYISKLNVEVMSSCVDAGQGPCLADSDCCSSDSMCDPVLGVCKVRAWRAAT